MSAYPQEIWYTRCPVPTPLGIAINLGRIEQDLTPLGIKVHSIQDSIDPEKRASHIDHHIRHSIRQGGSVPAIWARAAGADTRVIGLNWVDESQAIIALPGSGIHTPADIRGRRIALPIRRDQRIDIFRATALKALLAGLSLGGVEEHEVEWVDIDATDPGAPPAVAGHGGWSGRPLYTAEFQALVRGEVDAIHVKGSLGQEFAFLGGAHVVVDTGFHPDPLVRINNGTPRPLTIDAATLEEYPELAQRLLAHVIEAGEWAERHPEETLTYISRETGSSEQFVRAAYGGDDLHRRLKSDLSQESIDALAGFTAFLAERGFLPADFDVAAWVDRRPFESLQQAPRARAA